MPVKIADSTVGSGNFFVIAGPCSIESEGQFEVTAKHVKSEGAACLRGGMFKLRTQASSFQGLGQDAFDLARDIKKKVQLPFISEITDPRQISDLIDIVDVFQVGSRNMHNYALLQELGKTNTPVLLKRGFSGLIKEWLAAAEYITQGGNERVILCERGIRTFETATRNTLDLNAVAYIKQHSPFPVIVDPSHGTGLTSLVTPMSMAALAAGADGLIVEVHPSPEEALSDGFQALNFEQFSQLMKQIRALLPHFGRTMQGV
jgi:3-deoxy-7-phosphoheptulonate synthase